MNFNINLARKRYGEKFGEYALFFRSIAEKIDEYPDDIFKYSHEDSVRQLYTLRTLDAEKFFLLYEALTYGDIGVLFASPRTCLTGILLQFIGSKDQQDYYFDYVQKNFVRTFFATTEPLHGSDANQLKSKFIYDEKKEKISIFGEKMLVGNLGVATIGSIIGRVNDGPLGLCALLIKPEDFIENEDKIVRETLPMFGVKPALLGKAQFEGFKVNKNQLIGSELKGVERGLQAVIKTFNIMRLGITGLALGHAQGILDYTTASRIHFTPEQKNKLIRWQSLITGTRLLALEAAQENSINRIETSRISLAKVNACKIVENIATEVVSFYGINYIFEHPYLVKSLRDCFGYEYMDGTTNIQRKNIYQGFRNDKIKIS